MTPTTICLWKRQNYGENKRIGGFQGLEETGKSVMYKILGQ